MYERLTDKNNPPSIDFIETFIGERNCSILMQLETFLSSKYSLLREMKFPFGSNYGWGYKYSHKSSHLCYVFFESGAFTVTLQIGDNCVPKLEQILPHLSEKARDLWQNRYPCGSLGGWIHYRVTDANELNDIFEFIKVKKKPAK